MSYRSLRQCVDDLERHGQLVRIDAPIDARLEAAAIHRRVHAAGGPAIYFAKVVGCRFPMVSNLFGTLERARLLFRDTLERVRLLASLKADPAVALRSPGMLWRAPLGAWHMLPKRVRRGPVAEQTIAVDQLPQLVSWLRDGGPFVTLPIVYSEDVTRPGLGSSNLGMYRVQLAGNDYRPNEEIGLHYQIHRSIGVHHAAAIRADQPFRVNVLVGGPPALAVAAVMPMPEGMSELGFAGVLGGRRVRVMPNPVEGGLPVLAECDFCITGTVEPDRLLPEGPFGDHLGYYSLAHPFPVLRVERVTCRRDAIWPFTVVGRPPQEDTVFGQLIHEITASIIPTVLPGVHGVHAVDAAGVHPLLLAIGSERYMPFLASPAPQELLTQACAILGQGQLSLAKFLWIAARHDDPQLDLHDVAAFFRHMLSRADWRRDVHFLTHTTIDTLDYSGTGLNAGSKAVIAAVGPPQFKLTSEVPAVGSLPAGFADPRIALPGVLTLSGPRLEPPSFDGTPDRAARIGQHAAAAADVLRLIASLETDSHPWRRLRMIVVVDDSEFASRTLNNFVWTTFTRANPADDVYGVQEMADHKHWGCAGPLVIDARVKPHHAPAVEEDPATTRRVEQLAAPGGPLQGLY